MTREEIASYLAGKLGADKIAPLTGKPDAFCVVQTAALLECAQLLRDDEALRFDDLNSVTGIDYLKDQKIRVTYHFWSYEKRHDFILKVELNRDTPSVESLVPLWHSADWLEREQYDLLGVKFEHHPDLRRVLLPDDWVGHPHRKDYAEHGGYHNISNTRESPLDGFVRLDSLKKAQSEPAAAPAEPTKH